jgi:hypothetical protein
MKKLIGGAAFAVMASGALVNLGPTSAHANEATSCVWTPEKGVGEYPEGTVKEEFWGTETRPDGSVMHRYRLALQPRNMVVRGRQVLPRTA